MNLEKIANLIKKIRRENNLTQKEFADKLGVTYQAVSKWETGKNIPDIVILSQISRDYNVSLDEILNDSEETSFKKKTKNKFYLLIILITIIIVFFSLMFFLNKKDNDFEFKTLSTTCDNFTISGSISYNYQKSAIFISNIDYCGGEDKTEYENIECILYENENNNQNKISSYVYNEKTKITLEEFLKEVSFSIDNYNHVCNTYIEGSLNLVINANKANKTVTYNIPLSLDENC